MRLHYLFMIALLTLSFQGNAQVKTYTFKKGEALDLLLFNTVPDTGEKLQKYFKSAVKVAQDYGYIPQKGLRVNEAPLQGNYWPGTIIVGKWSDYDKRVKFTTDITETVPDFHKMRREIWSTFHLTYWEVQQDLTIEIEPNKYNVMTVYWAEGDRPFEKFNAKWAQTAKELGGDLILELDEGESPFGYEYKPDYLTITSWENKEAFDKFHKKNLAMDHSGVKHVNQFVIK